MNLIEKLGGYEKAIEYLENLNKIPLHEQTEDTITWLPDALLEYRRENNIFEVDDYVVYKGNAGLGGLFQIEVLTKTGKPKKVKTKRFGNFPCRYCEVQHATTEEIKAGHRL